MRKTERTYTYADYKAWPEGERWELIDGVAWDMSPAPSRNHQVVSRKLHGRLFEYFDTKPCQLYAAPFDVFFPETAQSSEDEVSTIVQPDIAVVCDVEKETSRGCWGAPDLVMEILSPWTSQKDLREKFELYERTGVREYWVIDPGGRYVRVFTLTEGAYGDGDLVEAVGIARSLVFDGLQIDLEDLFAEVRSF